MPAIFSVINIQYKGKVVLFYDKFQFPIKNRFARNVYSMSFCDAVLQT
jgi:hypothetical protein